ncbi:MAG TPA: ATP-dependent helicase HrpB [Pirellulales bacterium]|jgi:ATP-dependent helicase HrpB|nr:ATP-dependent helicase HrpB [Pirellulales bacterium]
MLPIHDALPAVIAALQSSNCLVLRAPTGAGKSTRVPPALLDAGLAQLADGSPGEIVLLQPRRLAARAAAARIAAERGTPLGDEIGYHVRFDRRVSRRTRIVSATEGVLLRRLQDDPLLENVAIVVFDEFHERSLNADLALAMVRRVQQLVRPDLRIVVMSATLAAEPVARYLGNCPIVESAGRLHPVEVDYLPHESTAPEPRLVADAVEQMLDRTPGDVLVFLPGVGEIRRAAGELAPLAERRSLSIVELYGELPLDQQQAALHRGPRRKVVLATNVAETSVTIEGVTAVVDTGTARVLRLDPALGINRLDVERISLASADQRAGRAGRTAPGHCLRLWTERQQKALADFDTPEVERVDLAGALLELACWGESDLDTFPWYEPPPAASLRQARILLERLGALDGDQPTDLGRAIVRLPVHPRLGRLLLEGARLGQGRRAALAAALLAERDPFPRAAGSAAAHRSASDVVDRVTALEEFARTGRRQTSCGPIDPAAARFVLRAADQLLNTLNEETVTAADRLDADEALLRAVFATFSDRLARRREPGSPRALMAGGRGVRLDRRSAVTDAELFVCVDIEERGQSESLVRMASAVERGWLPAERMKSQAITRFDRERQTVVAVRQVLYGDLVLEEMPIPATDVADTSQLLAAAAAERFDELFEADEPARQFVARVNSLRGWMAELAMPEITDGALRGRILSSWCRDKRSFDDLRRASMLSSIQEMLTHEQMRAVAREVPERIEVPSGSRIALHYEVGKSPVLAVRIQEVYGLRETPRIAGGRVPVVMHLLGPNQRVEQITTDLASFWKNTYPQVRKDLRRRYPKHSWPEDPYTAVAERRPSKKRPRS